MRSAILLASTALLLGLVVAQAEGHEQHHPADQASPPAPPMTPPSAVGPETMGRMQDGTGMPDRMMGPGSMCAMMMGPGMADAGAGGHDATDAPMDPVEGAFAAINRRMHRDMAAYAGEADQAFAAAMIAHHQGAVDMAKVILAFGQDPEIRKLAEEVVKAQEAEITFLRQWLARNPP
jgi:uncharacterized protein (DUF305 family)